MPESAVKFGSYEVIYSVRWLGILLTSILGRKKDGRTI